MLDALVDMMPRMGCGLDLQNMGGTCRTLRDVHGKLIVSCVTCHGRRRVLTDEGKALLALIPPEVMRSLLQEQEIPF